MAFGIRSNFASTSAHRALLGITFGAALGQSWRRLCTWTARSRKRDVLAERGDWLLRDVGVLRDRDIGVSREAAVREADKLFWRP